MNMLPLGGPQHPLCGARPTSGRAVGTDMLADMTTDMLTDIIIRHDHRNYHQT